MAYRSFREFLSSLEKEGELKRITIPVDTNLLVAEWADREMKSPGGGKALLFEQPIVDGKKSTFPVAINTMGSRRRMALALQVSDIADIAQEIQLILKAKPPTDLREGWSLLKQGIHLLHARPKHVRDAACQEVVHEIEKRSTPNTQRPTLNDFTLRDLPILKCWPKDGGRFITLANVHTRDPETGARNVGIYRMQIYDERTTSAVNGCRSQSRSAGIPFTHSPQQRRCQTDWMNCFLLGFCEGNQSSLFRAKRSTSTCRRTSILFWKAMFSRVKCGQKVPLAITPAFIQRLKTIRFSM
jgi:3-polyprenyl-4-hydroxybenzoate decarboxylase